jgi:capsular polysaccharide biosynthesis protein
VSPDAATSVRFIADELINQFGFTGRTKISHGDTVAGWPGDVPQSRMDSTKLRKAGFSLPRTSDEPLKLAIRRIIAWLAKRGQAGDDLKNSRPTPRPGAWSDQRRPMTGRIWPSFKENARRNVDLFPISWLRRVFLRKHCCETILQSDIIPVIKDARMAKQSARIAFIFWLRRFPGIYRIARSLCWAAANLVLNFFRKAVPAGWRWGPPKGFFSEYELLQKGELRGRVLFAAQHVPALAPNSLRKLCGLRQDEFQPWPAFWSCHSPARLVGRTLVLIDERKRLSLEGAYGAHCACLDPAWRTIRLPSATRLDGNWTSIVHQWTNGFHHWFMDALSHLVVLPELPADTCVIVPAQLASYQQDTLRWLGLENRIRPTSEKHLLVEHYYFCSATAMTGCYNPNAVEFLRRSFLSHADREYDPPRRFYLRRVGEARPILNEAELLEYFRRNGWDIVDTAQLSLARQIRLFSEAEMICAPHGAGLTNLLWCRPGCRVLELCASTALNGVYEGLAECVRANYRYRVFPGDHADRSRVNLETVKKALEF